MRQYLAQRQLRSQRVEVTGAGFDNGNRLAIQRLLIICCTYSPNPLTATVVQSGLVVVGRIGRQLTVQTLYIDHI